MLGMGFVPGFPVPYFSSAEHALHSVHSTYMTRQQGVSRYSILCLYDDYDMKNQERYKQTSKLNLPHQLKLRN